MIFSSVFVVQGLNLLLTSTYVRVLRPPMWLVKHANGSNRQMPGKLRSCCRSSNHVLIPGPSHQWVGEDEKNVRATFSLARRLSPCIIFIDEIDALFGARTTSSQPWYRATITQFMQEMDGLRTNKNSNVIVIGATNRPFDLDDAVL